MVPGAAEKGLVQQICLCEAQEKCLGWKQRFGDGSCIPRFGRSGSEDDADREGAALGNERRLAWSPRRKWGPPGSRKKTGAGDVLNSQKEGPEGGGAGPAVPGATRRSNPISAGLVSSTSLRALAQAAGADIWEGEGRVQGAGRKVVKCQ